MRDQMFITDFGACVPDKTESMPSAGGESGIADSWQQGCWRSIPYETTEGVCGTMLMATAPIDAPPLSLALNINGWYRVFVALGCPNLVSSSSCAIKLRLSSDPCYCVFETTGRHWWMEFEEMYWKTADLTDLSLHLAKPTGVHNGGPTEMQSYIAYLRLEPLSDQEIDQYLKEQAEAADLNLIGTEDGWSVIALDKVTTREQLFEAIYPYKDSCIKTILYNAAAGDYVNYPNTAVGTEARVSDKPIYPRALDKAWDQSMEIMRSEKIDVLEEVCDFAHSIGLRIDATVRTGSFACEPPSDIQFSTRFYEQHPELRCRDRDGREIPRLSYAYPEVQQHMIGLYLEIMQRNFDGFGWIFVRSLPMALYEEPLIDWFTELYGQDPRELEEDDPRVLALRSEIVTEFMIKAKTALDQLRKDQGRPPLKYSAIVPATRKVNELAGLDIGRLASEGLIDLLAVDFSIQDRNSPNNESPENMELDYFQQALEGTGCKLAPRLAYAAEPEGIRRVLEQLDRGIDSAMIWDTCNYYRYAPHVWKFVREYAKRENLERWQRESAAPERVFRSLKSLGEYTMDKFPGNLAY